MQPAAEKRNGAAESPQRKDEFYICTSENFIVREVNSLCWHANVYLLGSSVVAHLSRCHLSRFRAATEHFKARRTHEPDDDADEKLAKERKIQNKFMNGIHF